MVVRECVSAAVLFEQVAHVLGWVACQDGIFKSPSGRPLWHVLGDFRSK